MSQNFDKILREIPYTARKILYSAGSRKTTSVTLSDLTRKPPHPTGLSTEADHLPAQFFIYIFGITLIAATAHTHRPVVTGLDIYSLYD